MALDFAPRNQRACMNVLILGAGASYATHRLPVASNALSQWEQAIRHNCRLLAYALDMWLGTAWRETDLEAAWNRIDAAWKERAAGALPAVPDLNTSQRRSMWKIAFEVAAAEPQDPNYYRSQLEWARNQGYSAEQFLAVAAGWELRRLIQQTFVVPVKTDRRSPYDRLLRELHPSTVISFNYDTLLEQCLDRAAWSYSAFSRGSSRITVLKPHGSVSWTHRLPIIHQSAEQVHLDVTLAPEALGYRGGWLEQNLVIGLREKIEHTPHERSPVILTLFRDILGACETALASATEVWIVGYRFAPADTSYLEVLTRSLTARTEPPSLRVISHGDPDDLLPRIRDLFGFSVENRIPHCFCGFEIWADHGFCSE